MKLKRTLNQHYIHMVEANRLDILVIRVRLINWTKRVQIQMQGNMTKANKRLMLGLEMEV